VSGGVVTRTELQNLGVIVVRGVSTAKETTCGTMNINVYMDVARRMEQTLAGEDLVKAFPKVEQLHQHVYMVVVIKMEQTLAGENIVAPELQKEENGREVLQTTQAVNMVAVRGTGLMPVGTRIVVPESPKEWNGREVLQATQDVNGDVVRGTGQTPVTDSIAERGIQRAAQW
jgi:hypothetical protein